MFRFIVRILLTLTAVSRLTPPTHAQIVDLNSPHQDSISATGSQAFLDFIGDARIVVLGEQSHGTGSDYESFATLVKLLHEKKGFDVILNEFEYLGFQHVCDSIQKTSGSSQAYRSFMYWPQAKSNEYDFLFNYMDSVRNSHPVFMEGFDPRFRFSKPDNVLTDYHRILKQHEVSGELWDNNTAYFDMLESVLQYEYRDTFNKQARQDFLRKNERIENFLKSTSTTHRDLQFIKNVGAYIRNAWNIEAYLNHDPRRFMHREQQMASNIIFLADSVYPEHKIIIRTHNGHAARTVRALKGAVPDSIISGGETLGSHLDKRFGNEMKIVASTSFTGGHCGWDFKFRPLPEPDPASLESELACKGYRFAFVDLTKTKKDSFYMFYSDYNDWAPNYKVKTAFVRAFDGVIFTHTAQPATRKEEHED